MSFNPAMLDTLATFSDFLQIANFQLNLMDLTNGDIAHELHTQNSQYLDKIFKNQEEILQEIKQIRKIMEEENGKRA